MNPLSLLYSFLGTGGGPAGFALGFGGAPDGLGFGGGADGLVTTSTASPLFPESVTLFVGYHFNAFGGFPVVSAGFGFSSFFSFLVRCGILIGGSFSSPVGSSADTLN